MKSFPIAEKSASRYTRLCASISLEQRPLDLFSGWLENLLDRLLGQRDVVASRNDLVENGLSVHLHNNSAVDDFVHDQKDAVDVTQQDPLLHILPQQKVDRVVQAVQDRHQHQLVLLRAANDVEEQIHIAFVHNGEAVEQGDFWIGLVRLVEYVLFEGALFSDGSVGVVVIFSKQAFSIVVKYNDSFDCVQRRF